MASRSDQLHSQQFLQQRVVAALALRDPSSRRTFSVASLVAGVLVAAIAVGAVGVYGVLRPGGDAAWRGGSAVIVEEESGARFVLRDGVLHPVLNYSSALLILGSSDGRAATVRVARSSLQGVPRGPVLGIAGAPDQLPELVGGPWTVCSRPTGSVLLVGTGPALKPLGDDAMLAADPTGGLHLVWHARRFPIPAPELVLSAFAWSRASAVPVSSSVLNALPSGPDLVPLPVGTAGSSPVDGFRVGQVFSVTNTSGQASYGVVLATGLADITRVQADLLLAAGANGPSGRALPMGQALYASALRAAPLTPTGSSAPPASVPTLAVGPGLCAFFADGSAPSVGVGVVPASPTETKTRPGPRDLARIIDAVDLPPGRGVLVSSAGVVSLVGDLGVRYPLPSADAQRFLGFAGVTPVAVPPAVVALLPTGPALDPTAAALPATA